MRVAQVQYANLKGRSEMNLSLGAATIIVGPNFSGKTTVVDAIKLALLGYHPALDKTGRGVMLLASDSELRAGVTLVDENRPPPNCYLVGNVWNTKTDGRVSRRSFGPPPGELPEFSVATLDASQYFGATERERVDLIFRAVKLADDDEKTIAETAAEIESATSVETVNAIDAGARLRLPKGHASAQDWLDAALDAAERMRSDAAAGAKRSRALVQRSAEIASESTIVAVPEDAEEKLATKRKSLEDGIEKLHAIYDKRRATVERVNDGVDEANRAVEKMVSAIQAKEIEIGKAIARWEPLLNSVDCPLCGTSGDVWKKNAAESYEIELSRLKSERLELEREKNNRKAAADKLKADGEKTRTRAVAKERKDREETELTNAELREEIAALEAKLSAKTERDALEKAREESHRALKSLEDEAERLATAKTILLARRAALVVNVFSPILRVVNRLTAGVLTRPLAFNRGALGYWLDGDDASWITSETFSGAETAIVFAAFQAAIGASGSLKLAILDELGRIDRKRKARLLENVCAALQDGTIEQFIGIDTEPPPDDVAGFKVVERT